MRRQRIHLAPERLVARAGLRQEDGALARVAFQGGLADPFDVSATRARHYGWAGVADGIVIGL